MTKKQKINFKKAFTLIELLIVIAIIGVLAGVILVSTSSARQKASDSSMMQSVKSASTAVAACLISGTSLGVGVGLTPTEGTAICTGSGVWPDLPSTWSIVGVWWDAPTGYYWIRAFDGTTRYFICDHAPNSWGTDGLVGNNTVKCTKVGF